MPWRVDALRGACAALTVAIAQGSSLCPLPWNRNDSLPHGVDRTAICPHGTPFPIPKFDVTIPNNANWIDYICVVYGALPFIIIPLSVVDALFRAMRPPWGLKSRDLSFFAFVGLVVGMNELVFKNLMKMPRPERSCNFTCGFPSGHSTMALGFFTLLFCDGIFRVRTKLPLTLANARRRTKLVRGTHWQNWFRTRATMTADLQYWIKVVPLAADDTMDAFEFGSFTAMWGALLIPVPFSRVVLNDHTPEQVMVGSFIGICEAILWFFLVRRIQKRYNHCLGTRAGIFYHNYALPRFEVQSRCLMMLAGIEADYLAAEPNANADLMTRQNSLNTVVQIPKDGQITVAQSEFQRLCTMHKEIDWYIKHRQCTNIYPEDMMFHDIEQTNFMELQRKIEQFQSKMNMRYSVTDAGYIPYRAAPEQAPEQALDAYPRSEAHSLSDTDWRSGGDQGVEMTMSSTPSMRSQCRSEKQDPPDLLQRAAACSAVGQESWITAMTSHAATPEDLGARPSSVKSYVRRMEAAPAAVSSSSTLPRSGSRRSPRDLPSQPLEGAHVTEG